MVTAEFRSEFKFQMEEAFVGMLILAVNFAPIFIFSFSFSFGSKNQFLMFANGQQRVGQRASVFNFHVMKTFFNL